jgi:hypothetical protein
MLSQIGSNNKINVRKKLEELENEKLGILMEDIVEYNDVIEIVSEIEFYQHLVHEYLMEDLQSEMKLLRAQRDILESRASTFVARSGILKMLLFMRDKDLDGLKYNYFKIEIFL